jgi:RHS repeat-associated protein
VSIGYAYDQANRLTSLTYSGLAGGTQTLTYTYDPAGNRTVMGGSWARTLLPAAIGGASYDAANRQLTLGAKTMYYDFNGSLETLTEGGNTTTFTWDVRNRLTNITGPGLSASFVHDPIGRRTRKTIAGFTTDFQYDRRDIVREVAGGANVHYLRGLAMDEPLARITDTDTTCYIPGTLDSTWALSDMNGATSTSYTYEPFGQTNATGTSSANPFQFTGRENDGTGYYYYRARFYAPALARFLSEDPLGLAGGDHNLYRYVFNAPTSLTDPLGWQAKLCCRDAGWKKPGEPSTHKGYQHCYIVDDRGGTHSFSSEYPTVLFQRNLLWMVYKQGHPVDAAGPDSNCGPCLTPKCWTPERQRLCFEAWGYALDGFYWQPSFDITSNSGVGEMARRCCANGVPEGLKGRLPGIRSDPKGPIQWPDPSWGF